MGDNAVYDECQNLQPAQLTPGGNDNGSYVSAPSFLTQPLSREALQRAGTTPGGRPMITGRTAPALATAVINRLGLAVGSIVTGQATRRITVSAGYTAEVVQAIVANPLGYTPGRNHDSGNVFVSNPKNGERKRPTTAELEKVVADGQGIEQVLAELRLVFRRESNHLVTYLMLECGFLDENLTLLVKRTVRQRCAHPELNNYEVFGRPSHRLRGIDGQYLRDLVMSELRYRPATSRASMMLSCQVRTYLHDLNSWLSQIYADGAQANQSIYAAMGLGTFNVDGDFASPYEQFASVAGTQSDSPTPHYDVSDEEAQDQGDEGEEEEEEEESDGSADVDEERSQEERPPVKGPYPARDPYWGLAPLNVFDFSYRQMSAAEQKYILRMLGEWDVDMADPHKAGFLSWTHIRRLVEDTRDLPNPPALPSKEDYKAFSECTPRWPLASSKKTSQPEEEKPKGDHKRKDRAKGASTLGSIQKFKHCILYRFFGNQAVLRGGVSNLSSSFEANWVLPPDMMFVDCNELCAVVLRMYFQSPG